MKKSRILGLLIVAIATVTTVSSFMVNAEEAVMEEVLNVDSDISAEEEEISFGENSVAAVNEKNISQGTFDKEITNVIKYNEFYNFSDMVISEAYGADVYYLDLNFPQDGRMKVIITDCQIVNSLERFSVYKGADWINSFYYSYVLTEDADSGWITVNQDRYVLCLPKQSFNKEAKVKVIYESSDAYNGEVEPNNKFDQATFIKNNVLYEGNASKQEDKDYYKFTLEKNGSVDISTTKYYELYEEDANGNVSKINSNKHLRLMAGNYYIVMLRLYSGEYTVCVNVNYESAEDYEQENNNVKSQANEINFNHWYTGNLNTSSDIDCFKVQVTETSILALELKISRQKVEKFLKISLYDENMNQVLTQAYTTENPYLKTLEVICPIGIYYVRIENGGYNNNDCEDYSFNVNQKAYAYITNIELAENKTVLTGETFSLDYMVLPADADQNYLSWRSSNENIATVDENGTIYAKNAGTTQIILKATDRNLIADSCYLTVREPIHVKSVEIPESKTVTKGDTFSLKATVLPEDADNKKLNWSSSDSSIVTVDKDGKVIAKGVGTAYIIVNAADDYYSNHYWLSSSLYAECKITVKKPVKYVDKLKFSEINPTLLQGDYYEMQPVVSPSDADNKAIKWYSSNSIVAEVDKKGVVYGRRCGTAQITAIAKDRNKISVSYTITVYRKVNYKLGGGKNNSENPSRYIGKTIKLKNPERKGYLFKGWYADKKYKKKVTSVTEKNTTFYAKWEKVKLGKPTIVSVKNKSGEKALLRYKSIKNANGYQIVCSSDKKLKKNCMSVIVKSQSYTFEQLVNGKTYYIKLRAYRKDSTGEVVYGKYSFVRKVKIKK